MIDIHTHILPGVDDGVKTEDDAVEFARMAYEDGVRTIVATPHCKEGFFVNERDDVLEAVGRLDERVRGAGIEMTIEPGAEVHLCPDLVARVRDGRALTLGDNGTTLLLELSLTQYPVELENLVFQLKLADIEPVFAHPERIRYFQDDVKRYEAVVRLGAHGQITTGSILGQFGREAREFAVEILRKGLVDVLASDAHNTHRRPPGLREALEAIVPLVGARRAESMVQDVPRALLDGEVPEVPPVDGASARRRSVLTGWLRRRG